MDIQGLATIRITACDLNGQMRGKRLPTAMAGKLDRDGARMPLSCLNVDIFGSDIEDSPLVFESGDADGILLPTGRGPVAMPWLSSPSALIPIWMFNEDKTLFAGDPRHVLAHVLDRYAARGWQVIAATEMEFTLLAADSHTAQPPLNPTTGRRLGDEEILSLAELDAFDALFSDLYEGASRMGIPAQAGISESGVGQFEINLNHQDALRCADDAWLFKTLVRGMARKHGFMASFMAKPYADDAGNGMHVHFSVLDQDGRNIFDDGTARGTAQLLQAVAGCVASMPASTLIFAPHGNSYTRLVPGAHAPTGACWAYENRTAAIRIPGGSPKVRRIEHRVAGGDTNPYLMLAAILGAAMTGIEDEMEPPPPVTGNAYAQAGLPQLEPSWEAAITRFETDQILTRFLPRNLIANLAMTKRQELARFSEMAEDDQWISLAERV